MSPSLHIRCYLFSKLLPELPLLSSSRRSLTTCTLLFTGPLTSYNSICTSTTRSSSRINIDVKNMYPSLSQSHALQALDWCIHNFKKTCRRTTFIATGHGPRGVHTGGVAYNTDDFVNIHIDDLIQIIRYDVLHCYISTVGILLHQIFGLPMGSPNSVPLAIITMAFAEHKTLNSLFASRSLRLGLDDSLPLRSLRDLPPRSGSGVFTTKDMVLLGTRFVDDLQLAVNFDRTINPDLPSTIMDTLKSHLPPGIELEVEYERSTRFLECVTSIDITEPHVTFYRFLRNTSSILRSGIQDFPTLIPWDDAHTSTQKYSCLINAVYSIIRHTIPSYHFVFMGLVAVYFEFCFVLRYPIRTFVPTLHSVALKSRDTTLIAISNHLIYELSKVHGHSLLSNPRLGLLTNS